MSKILIDRAVVEQALDWFDWLYTGEPVEMMVEQKSADIRQALRTALAEQPAEQEKLAIMQRIVDSNTGFIRNPTTPQPAKREPLTREEIDQLWCEFPSDEFGFAHAIIAAYERKNISNSQPPTKEVP